MGLGRFGKRLIASAKLASMEKYGYGYAEDLAVIEEFLSDEVLCEHLEDNRVRFTRNGHSFEVEIRGKVPGMLNYKRRYTIEPCEERKGKWVSIFDPANH